VGDLTVGASHPGTQLDAEFDRLKREAAGLATSDRIAMAWVVHAAVLSTGGIWLSLTGNWLEWVVGQIIVACSMFNWFSIMHDCGHKHFFSNRWANDTCGWIAGTMIVFLYEQWKTIHALHHRWNGWVDKDPTSQGLARGAPHPTMRIAMDWAWRLWIPLFTLTFGIMGFWDLRRTTAFCRNRIEILRQALNLTVVVLVYVGLAVTFRTLFFQAWALAFVLFLIVSDPFLLSQHVHLPQLRSGGAKVSPLRYRDQAAYTRELVLPSWAATHVFMNFNRHIIHHLFPQVPCYRLPQLRHAFENKMSWWRWLREAKSIPAHRLLFEKVEPD